MPDLTIDGKSVAVDDEGFLVDPDDWSEELAAHVAEQEGIPELTDRHWQVIRFCRDDFAETGAVPGLRRVTKQSGVPTKELYQLFPKGPAKKVARIAGLSKPKGCV